MRCLGWLGKGSALWQPPSFNRLWRLLLREEAWEQGKEVAKICPSSHSRGETTQRTCQAIKTWWGDKKPQPKLIASTATTLSHHSFGTYVQQQCEDWGSQLHSEHRGEEVRTSAWERPRDKFHRHSEIRFPLPSSSQCHHQHLYHMQTILSLRTKINTCGCFSYLHSTFAKMG